jgi:outer membrane autotransporter protein
MVRDANGSPVPNAVVTFQAPTSGASGTFPGGTSSATVVTSSSGGAVAPTFTANGVTGSYAVTASVPGASAPAVFQLTNGPVPGFTIAIFAVGDPAPHIPVGGTITLTVRATENGAPPAPNVSVALAAAPDTRGSVPPSVTIPAGAGEATFTATSNGGSGVFTVTATAGGQSAVFTVTVDPASAATIAVSAGSGQTAAVGTPFATPLRALVKDGSGNPTPNVSVTFTAPATGASGTFSGSNSVTVTTDASGIATAPAFTANATAGSYAVTASAAGVATPASFALTNTSGPIPSFIAATAGTPQSAPVATVFATALRARVVDSTSSPVPNVAVTFQAPASGASGTFSGSSSAIVATNAQGVAIAPALTANATPGSYVVTASAAGVAGTASFSLTNVASKGDLSIAVASNGKDGTFNFAVTPTVAGLAAFSLATAGGTASRSFPGVPSGTYTITLGQLQPGFKLTSAACGAAPASGSSVTVTITGGPASCSFAIAFDAESIRTGTQAAIKNFMRNRADAIASAQPKQTRGEGRFTGSLFGGGASDGNAPAEKASASNLGGPRPAVPFSPPFADNGGRTAPTDAAAGAGVASPLAVSGGDGGLSAFLSLAAVRDAATRMEAKKAQDAGIVHSGVGGNIPGAKGGSAFDIWAEVQWSHYRSDFGDKRSGFTQLAYFGLDYLVHPAVLVGVMAQVDWANETLAGGRGADGMGWMVGPYAAVKVTPQVTFDARAAWGRSDNSVDPFGTYEDAFETSRWLLSARLTGSWQHGPWRLSPEASLVYFEETQKGFTSQTGVAIPGQAVSLGRVMFGPTVGYQIKTSGESMVEPFVGIKGVYDFGERDAVAPDGSLIAPDVLRGRVEAGLSINVPSGLTLQGSVSYDGIGAGDFQNVQGQLSVRVPLN